MAGIVAIVGRPNVGKSTLFNRLIGERKAIVDNVSGVTRDRHYGKSDWIGTEFTVIDTGGYVTNSNDIFETHIREQVELAIAEADVLLFMVDAVLDPNDLDIAFFKIVRQSKKPYLLVANKADNDERMFMANSYYSMGVEMIYPISSLSGSGTGELLDDLIKDLPKEEERLEDTLPRFAVVGRPNAGKSSFINALIGEDRYIVTDIAGTTRDSIDTKYNRFGFDFNLVDTAGIRRKAKVKEDIEFYSVMRSVRAIEHADVCLLIVDGTRGFDGQVQNIFWLAHRNNKGVVILVNKWDLLEKDTHASKKYEERIREATAPFTDVPIIFISSFTKQRIFKAVETAVEVYQNRARRIPTKAFNNVMLPIIEKTPPPSYKGKYVKIKFCTQLPTPHPQFAFFCNLPQYVKDPYRRFLENKLREQFDFEGVPIQIFFRKK